ncbi:hypothetical protein TBLA_0G01090 [Henningerozyma blattae CBS 6284]|uniref:Zn(2)-C6 fungal-type domain-containing protein n=1 Tax=Henningerozyma blattae (strain ATCC 34711 / CBS 6284 / DSM 70876 / NBRC 10599 / NRRL Y-10934 / UCD 77-7) TaxID=1071380 RepID=I2H6Q3_HENB6|nr:hypothetical protein TBLA_0G01090 [Tetrapisispora blattae CBS 6284]CCH62055.1 hypothetical protein TBLA_0G01090 [Tetrapisispora blattae CBS 6284]
MNKNNRSKKYLTNLPKNRAVYSRHGCFRCKKMHLKCDEAKPVCSRCKNTQNLCQYQSEFIISTVNSTKSSNLIPPMTINSSKNSISVRPANGYNRRKTNKSVSSSCTEKNRSIESNAQYSNSSLPIQNLTTRSDIHKSFNEKREPELLNTNQNSFPIQKSIENTCHNTLVTMCSKDSTHVQTSEVKNNNTLNNSPKNSKVSSYFQYVANETLVNTNTSTNKNSKNFLQVKNRLPVLKLRSKTKKTKKSIKVKTLKALKINITSLLPNQILFSNKINFRSNDIPPFILEVPKNFPTINEIVNSLIYYKNLCMNTNQFNLNFILKKDPFLLTPNHAYESLSTFNESILNFSTYLFFNRIYSNFLIFFPQKNLLKFIELSHNLIKKFPTILLIFKLKSSNFLIKNNSFTSNYWFNLIKEYTIKYFIKILIYLNKNKEVNFNLIHLIFLSSGLVNTSSNSISTFSNFADQSNDLNIIQAHGISIAQISNSNSNRELILELLKMMRHVESSLSISTRDDMFGQDTWKFNSKIISNDLLFGFVYLKFYIYYFIIGDFFISTNKASSVDSTVDIDYLKQPLKCLQLGNNRAGSNLSLKENSSRQYANQLDDTIFINNRLNLLTGYIIDLDVLFCELLEADFQWRANEGFSIMGINILKLKLQENNEQIKSGLYNLGLKLNNELIGIVNSVPINKVLLGIEDTILRQALTLNHSIITTSFSIYIRYFYLNEDSSSIHHSLNDLLFNLYQILNLKYFSVYSFWTVFIATAITLIIKKPELYNKCIHIIGRIEVLKNLDLSDIIKFFCKLKNSIEKNDYSDLNNISINVSLI